MVTGVPDLGSLNVAKLVPPSYKARVHHNPSLYLVYGLVCCNRIEKSGTKTHHYP